VRRFWADLEVEQKLDQWTATALSGSGLPAAGFGLRVPGVGLPGSSSELRVSSSAHATVWDQMNGWLANVELAFGEEALALADWLPILEAGLANLSVGVIPPALDQVLIGAIDRSRNPELKLVVLPGWNETVFPALPEPGPLLTESERDALAGLNVRLGLSRRQQIGRERYYAYIACTRARQGVLVTRAARDADGQTLYPSPFFDQLKRLAGVGEETFPGVEEWRDSEHACELAAPLLRALAAPDPDPELMRLAELPAFAPLVRQWREWEASAGHPRLAPAVAESLYGRELHSSVSGLEGFAACPFKFFAARGLRLQERKEFQVDARDQGSFQHEVLREFHQRIQKSGRRWRDLDAAEARDLVCAIGHELLPVYGGGRFRAAAAARFAGEFLIERLGRLVTTLIEWMPQYGFDPERAEVSFGLEEGGLPAWKLALPGNRALLLRGRMDRVDLCREGDGPALAVVVDYKSRARALNPTRLHHGLDLQLLSYLGALRQLSPTKPGFGAAKLLPVGAFYIPLNGGAGRPGTTRAEVLGGGDAARRAGYQHSGRFRADALSHLDNRDVRRGDQFRFWKREDGGWRATGNDAMPAAEFEVLREKIEDRLREFATRIYAGEMDVAPYRLGSETACDRCEFRAVCRFDPWTQPFRQLRPPPKPERASPLKSASHFQTNG
jgi:ATP-dependent helicase/nuclease subunit B